MGEEVGESWRESVREQGTGIEWKRVGGERVRESKWERETEILINWRFLLAYSTMNLV